MRTLVIAFSLMLSSGVFASADQQLMLYPVFTMNSSSPSVALESVIDVGNDSAVRKQLVNKVLVLDKKVLKQINRDHAIGRSTLQSLLSQQFPSLKGYQLLGRDVIRVKRAVVYADSKKLLARIEKRLTLLLPDNYRNLSIRYMGNRKNLRVDSKATLSMQIDAVQGYIPPRVAVNLLIDNDSGHSKRTMWFDVNYEAPVSVLSRDVEARSSLMASALTMAWHSNRDIGKRLFTLPDMNEALWRFRAAFKQGDIVRRDMLEVKPAMDYGEKIKVAVTVGGICIESFAIAMQTASVGDDVRLKSISSGDFFVAKVVDEGLAHVAAR